MVRDIPLTSDPLLLADWREAAGLVLDRLLAAGLAAPAALRSPAAALPAASAALLAAAADGAARAAALYCDKAALDAREAGLSSAWDRWRYDGDGTARVRALRGDGDRPDAELRDTRRCTVLETLDPLPAAPPPGAPLRSEEVRRCLASVVRAMRRCRYLFAPPSAFRGARRTVWARRDDGVESDRISRVGPSSMGFASASAWLAARARGGAQALGGGSAPGIIVDPWATDTPHLPLYSRTWRVLGDEAEAVAAYPSVVFHVLRMWAAVETLTYRDPAGDEPTSYSYGGVFPCTFAGEVSLSAEGAGMLPRNPRARAVLWHLWPGGWDSAWPPGWSASAAPRLVPGTGLYDGVCKWAWDTPDGYSPDVDLWHLTRGPWVETGPAEPLVPAAISDFPSGRAWVAQPDDLHGGAFCKDSPVASRHTFTIGGTDYYGYEADLALVDVGEAPAKETLT